MFREDGSWRPAGTTIPVGASTATLIPVGTSDTVHCSVVHMPGLNPVIAGVVVYNLNLANPYTLWVAAHDLLRPL
ncbi:hypothetical protein [Nonomuraea sp. NPDC049141]|uniref:hypothetical protein n=1 Tax=unclassified Nonomuraea TaxID=2593643 RepID=UPI0033DB1ED3